MHNASWIYAFFAGVAVAIPAVLGFFTFLDDLRQRFLWTRGPSRWTKARLALSSTGFGATGRCKTTISTSAQGLNAFRDRFLGRKGESALTYELELRRWGERFVPRAAIGPIQLKPTQQRAVAALTADPAAELTRGQYEELAGVSRSQAAYDLAELVEAGLLDRIGNGRATRYRLAREGGTQRHWTNERIFAELEAFCADRETWPSAGDFKSAGRGDLYVAASRYGGIAHWTEALGFARATRNEKPVPQPSPLRTKLKWAGAGAVAALGLAAAAGAIVVSLDRHGASRAAPALSERVTDESLHPLIAQARTTRRAAARLSRRQRAHASSATRSRRHATSASRRSAVVQTSATSSVSGARTFFAVTAAPASWPAPLRAPSGGSAPPPMKAP
jgi:hypothetical protein